MTNQTYKQKGIQRVFRKIDKAKILHECNHVCRSQKAFSNEFDTNTSTFHPRLSRFAFFLLTFHNGWLQQDQGNH